MKPNNNTKRRPYPEKHRQKCAENCHKNKPWTRATGPKTQKGKENCAKNAYKHGAHSHEATELRRIIKEQRNFIKGLEKKRKTP